MKLGTFIHTGVLEPNGLQKRYAVCATRKGSTTYNKLIDKGVGPVTQAQWDQALAMCDSVRNHPETAWLLSEGKAGPISLVG